MTPELLKQIEASVQRDADREFVHYAQKDRAALLDYCRELEARESEIRNFVRAFTTPELENCRDQVRLLEAALDWAIEDATCAEGLAFFEVPPHLAPILAASRKRINGSYKT